MKIVKLHEFPSLMDDCCALLNQEWPRSKAARLHSLSKSKDSYPMCLCLLDDVGDGGDDMNTNAANPRGKLIGHVKVSRGITDGEAYIESLIIDKSRRGQGVGRKFMSSIEKLLESYGFSSISLHTIDASSFYQKLGYIIVETIEALGPANQSIATSQSAAKTHGKPNISEEASSSAVPVFPPPPPLPLGLPLINRPLIKQEKIVMKKTLR
ncbi:N-acetyltransferase 6 [Tetranychus urticae]|uniref:N-acetyltransferase domain-containing protein n=1 Tax=Tetranychus urticae TaxID=32264 RepID=A0A158P5H1_TETUR|nr:N-acetyltransferase 6 [Tetranychus urticae]